MANFSISDIWENKIATLLFLIWFINCGLIFYPGGLITQYKSYTERKAEFTKEIKNRSRIDKKCYLCNSPATRTVQYARKNNIPFCDNCEAPQKITSEQPREHFYFLTIIFLSIIYLIVLAGSGYAISSYADNYGPGFYGAFIGMVIVLSFIIFLKQNTTYY